MNVNKVCARRRFWWTLFWSLFTSVSHRKNLKQGYTNFIYKTFAFRIPWKKPQLFTGRIYPPSTEILFPTKKGRKWVDVLCTPENLQISLPSQNVWAANVHRQMCSQQISNWRMSGHPFLMGFFCQKVTVKTHNFLTKKDLFDSFLTIEEFPLKVHVLAKKWIYVESRIAPMRFSYLRNPADGFKFLQIFNYMLASSGRKTNQFNMVCDACICVWCLSFPSFSHLQASSVVTFLFAVCIP